MKGKFKARAKVWKLGVSGTGSEHIAVLLETNDGNAFPWRGFFTEKTVERTLESMEYMGWDGESISSPVGLDRNEVQIVVEEETNEENGQTYSKVRWINRLGGGLSVKEELAGPALMSFEQRMKGTLLARKQSRPKPPAQQRASQASQGYDGPPEDDDDPLPF